MALKKTYGLVEIEYDDFGGATAEDVVHAVARVLNTGIGVHGDPGRDGIKIGALELFDLNDQTFQVADAAGCSIKPITMRVRREAYGISITAEGDNGLTIGDAFLDYFDDELQVLAYGPEEDEPRERTLVCASVEAERQKTADTTVR